MRAVKMENNGAMAAIAIPDSAARAALIAGGYHRYRAKQQVTDPVTGVDLIADVDIWAPRLPTHAEVDQARTQFKRTSVLIYPVASTDGGE